MPNRFIKRTFWWAALVPMFFISTGCGYLGTYYNKRILEDACMESKSLVIAGQLKEAEITLVSAVPRLAMADPLDRALFLEQRAKLNWRRQQIPNAVEDFKRARTEYLLATKNRKESTYNDVLCERVADIDLSLGRLIMAEQQPASALKFFESAAQGYETVLKSTPDLCAEFGLRQSLLAYAELAEKSGNVLDAKARRDILKRLDQADASEPGQEFEVLRKEGIKDLYAGRLEQAIAKLERVYEFVRMQAPGSRAQMETAEHLTRGLAAAGRNPQLVNCIVQDNLLLFRNKHERKYLAPWELQVIPSILQAGNPALAKDLLNNSLEIIDGGELDTSQLKAAHRLLCTAVASFGNVGNPQDMMFALRKFTNLSARLGLINTPAVLATRTELAFNLERAGNLTDSEGELEKIYQIQKKSNELRPFTGVAWKELSDRFWQKCDATDSVHCALRAMEVNSKEDTEYCNTASRCAYLLKQGGAYNEAVNASNKAITGLSESSKQYSAADRAWIYAYAACAEFGIGNAPLASAFWEKADALAPRRTSQEKSNYATMKQTVFDSRWRDLVRLHTDNPARALAFGRDSVELRRKAFGENSSSYKQSLGSLNDFMREINRK